LHVDKQVELPERAGYSGEKQRCVALLFDGDQGPRPFHWPVIKAEDVDGEMTCGLEEGFCPVGV